MKIIQNKNCFDDIESFFKSKDNFRILEENTVIVRKNNRTLALKFGNDLFLKDIQNKLNLPNLTILDIRFESLNTLKFDFVSAFKTNRYENKYFYSNVCVLKNIQDRLISVETSNDLISSEAAEYEIFKFFAHDNYVINVVELKKASFIFNIALIKEINTIDMCLGNLTADQFDLISLFDDFKLTSTGLAHTINILDGNIKICNFIKEAYKILKSLCNKQSISFKIKRTNLQYGNGTLYIGRIFSITVPFDESEHFSGFIELAELVDYDINIFKTKIYSAYLTKV